MNAGASLSAVPSPIEGSGTAWVLLGSWALSPARPTPIPPRHECRGFSALLGESMVRAHRRTEGTRGLPLKHHEQEPCMRLLGYRRRLTMPINAIPTTGDRAMTA